MTTAQMILIQNGYISIEPAVVATVPDGERIAALATILSNIAYYGYIIDSAAIRHLSTLDIPNLVAWWQDVRPVFAAITGSDRNMEDHIVYRNFPKEALDLDKGQQVFHQIAIYMGFPYDWFRQPEAAREPLGELSKLKVLRLASGNTLSTIHDNLIEMSNRWSDNQKAWAIYLTGRLPIIVDNYGFKENGIILAAEAFKSGVGVEITTATDVLRLAAQLSDQDVSLRNRVAFRNFKRAERRTLLSMLEDARNIKDDFALRPELAKRLMERLRPGDYKFERVRDAYDALYKGELSSIGAKLDPQTPNVDMLTIAATRPGEFLRRLHHYIDLFGLMAVDQFVPVMNNLTTRQLVSLRRYIATINDRTLLIYPPRANWARAQVSSNEKSKLSAKAIALLDGEISRLLCSRISARFPEGIDLADNLVNVKLQTNDQKLAEYGRGTTFDIPEDVTFVRSASYWELPHTGDFHRNTWFDNGWNFFHDDWSDAGTCGWDAQHLGDGAAIMSGDPTNIKDLRGRGCQIIDLYFDKLIAMGIRYAVWNVLCFSNIKFSDAKDVLATLQWGVEPLKGNVYEPSRAQMVFPLRAEQLSSYVAYVDLVTRKLVYMDAPLPANVGGTGLNSARLTRVMPAYVQYLDSLPSLHDLLRDVPSQDGAVPVRFEDDAQTAVAARSYVFQPTDSERTGSLIAISDFVEVV